MSCTFKRLIIACRTVNFGHESFRIQYRIFLVQHAAEQLSSSKLFISGVIELDSANYLERNLPVFKMTRTVKAGCINADEIFYAGICERQFVD